MKKRGRRTARRVICYNWAAGYIMQTIGGAINCPTQGVTQQPRCCESYSSRRRRATTVACFPKTNGYGSPYHSRRVGLKVYGWDSGGSGGLCPQAVLLLLLSLVIIIMLLDALFPKPLVMGLLNILGALARQSMVGIDGCRKLSRKLTCLRLASCE